MKGHLYLIETLRANEFARICDKFNKEYWREPCPHIEINGKQITKFYFNRRDYKVYAILQETKEKNIFYDYEGCYF